MNIEFIEKNTDIEVEYHESIESTNERAKAIAEETIAKISNLNEFEKSIYNSSETLKESGAILESANVNKENLAILKKDLEKNKLVIAENQTKGKGTNGRIWYSNKNENILMTLIFYPQNYITELQGITYSIAEMIKYAIQDLYNISLDIKLPNDLLLNGKKICGILTESSIQDNKVNYLLIGIGFNVNQIKFSEEIEDIATSLKKENLEKEFSREEIIVKIINNIKSLIR